jgi:putative ABC transport system permease protein
LVKRFPNLLVVDVAAVLAQVQAMMDQVIRAVEYVFLFSVAAGILVLFAAIQSTHDERVREAAILRTLGGDTRQLRQAQAAEFVAVGALSGLLAAVGATALGWVLADRVLNVPYVLNPWVWAVGLVAGAAGVLAAGLLGTRQVVHASPMETLRRA